MNRVSLGVQSFDDDLLKGAGRSHTSAEAEEAVGVIRAAGIENWSLDLISGLPHQRADIWEATLRTAIALEPSHLSVYDLQVEDGTAFGRWFDDDEREDPANPLPSSDEAAEF